MSKISYISIQVLIIVFYFSCKQSSMPQVMTENVQSSFPEWAKSSNIYEVNIRQYTPEGTFNAFFPHLSRLRSMGVDILWFMPIYPISDTKKKGSLGSYYAVSDFNGINKEFGTLEDFKLLVSEAHKLGMKVILDWVPNHTGWDHVWLETHPEYYTKDSLGNVTDPLDDNGKSMGWTDVADLNYNNMSMRSDMIKAMKYWIEEFDIDGFRCDMALLVPLDFWAQASDSLKKVKNNIFMLAESEVIDHVNNEYFNAIYGWSLHHTLNDIAQSKKSCNDLDNWFKNNRNLINNGVYMHFTSNHDENSWSGSEIERMGESHQTFAVLTYFLDGIPLVYSGQEEPMPKRLEFFEKDTIPFKNYSYHNFYTQLNKIKNENPALWNADYGGSIEHIMENQFVFVATRSKNDNKVLGIFNLDKQRRQIKFDRLINGVNLLTGENVNFSVNDTLELAPWAYVLCKVSE